MFKEECLKHTSLSRCNSVLRGLSICGNSKLQFLYTVEFVVRNRTKSKLKSYMGVMPSLSVGLLLYLVYTSVRYSHLDTNIQFKEMGACRMAPSTTRLSSELRKIVNCCYSYDRFVKSTTWSC